MAESDTRLETLEDEVKVLKGEVKRTLVDLRALLMKENSPLGESNFARRSATADQSSKSGGSEKVVIAVAAPIAAGPMPAPPPAPAPVLVTAAVPSPEGGLPGPALAQVGVAPPVTSAPQTGPEPAAGIFPTESSQLVATPVQRDPGPGSFPMVSPPGAMTLPAEDPGPAPDWAGLAEQERRMAEQERRILEQERRMSERERLLTEASRHQGPSSRQVNEDLWLEEEAEELTAAKASRRNGRSHKQILGMSYSPEAAGGKYSVGEVSQVLQDIPDDVTPLPERRSRRLRQNESEQGHRSPPRDEDSGLDLDRLEMKQLNEDDLESPEPGTIPPAKLWVSGGNGEPVRNRLPAVWGCSIGFVGGTIDDFRHRVLETHPAHRWWATPPVPTKIRPRGWRRQVYPTVHGTHSKCWPHAPTRNRATRSSTSSRRSGWGTTKKARAEPLRNLRPMGACPNPSRRVLALARIWSSADSFIPGCWCAGRRPGTGRVPQGAQVAHVRELRAFLAVHAGVSRNPVVRVQHHEVRVAGGLESFAQPVLAESYLEFCGHPGDVVELGAVEPGALGQQARQLHAMDAPGLWCNVGAGA